jgi:hypothetical protein
VSFPGFLYEKQIDVQKNIRNIYWFNLKTLLEIYLGVLAILCVSNNVLAILCTVMRWEVIKDTNILI